MRFLLILLLAVCPLPAANYYLTVAGLGGTPEYEAAFAKWALDLGKELQKNGPEAVVITLSGPGATKTAFEQAISSVASKITAEDQFSLFLIGHGTFDGTDYKFNLPGPDITAAQMATLLNRLPARKQLVVNMTSCSGASMQALARKDRIVITATKSGTEKNATVFPRYWIDALRDPAADIDKNGTVTTLEAFRYADNKTAAYFETEKLLATEHPMLTDVAGQKAVRDPKPENGQGLLAARFPVITPEAETAHTQTANPEKKKLLDRKEELEARIDKLKYEKAAMAPEEYQQQLTALLLELARTQAGIDR